MIHVDIINKSTVLSDDDALRYVNAIQKQVSFEFCTAWGVDAVLHFITKSQASAISIPADPKHWWIAILDDATIAGALGFHDLNPTGLPIGYVFAKTDLQFGAIISVTLSHEVTEQLVDPYCNYCVQLTPTEFVALEVGDPVEADSDGYDIDGVRVSNFVLPEYFEGGSDGPYDYRGQLNAHMPALRPEGYISVWDGAKGWGQRNGRAIANGSIHAKFRARPHMGSRRERRTRPRDEWLPSEIK